MHNKKIVFIFSKAPYISSISQSGINNVLAHASFDCDCTVIFVNDGVKQLDKSVELELKPNIKNISKQISAFPLYNINNIFVCTDALKRFEISTQQLATPATGIEPAKIVKLLEKADFIYHY